MSQSLWIVFTKLQLKCQRTPHAIVDRIPLLGGNVLGLLLKMLHSDSWNEELCFFNAMLIDPAKKERRSVGWWTRRMAYELVSSPRSARQWECSFSPDHLVACACFLLRWFLWWALTTPLNQFFQSSPTRKCIPVSASLKQLWTEQHLFNFILLPPGKSRMERSTGKRLSAGLGKQRDADLYCNGCFLGRNA